VSTVQLGSVVPPGGTPTVAFDPETGVLQLDTVQGPPGQGIAAASVSWPADWREGDPSNAVIRNDPANANRRTLFLKLPRGVATAAKINALSWRHGSTFTDFDALFKQFSEPGLVIGFDRGVTVSTVSRFTLQLWLRRPSSPGSNLMVEELVALTDANIVPFEIAEIDTSDPEHPLITTATVAAGADKAKAVGVLLTADQAGNLANELKSAERGLDSVGVRMLCDFVLDDEGNPVDGNHLGGRLPTGNGVYGDSFESWLEFRPGD
jgi:hypothetical protein